MSRLDSIKPQRYAPVRLKHQELEPFFKALKNRELVLGDDVASVKLSDKPFQAARTIQRDLSESGGTSKKPATKRSKPTLTKQQGAPKTKPKKKPRVKIERKLKKATL